MYMWLKVLNDQDLSDCLANSVIQNTQGTTYFEIYPRAEMLCMGLK